MKAVENSFAAITSQEKVLRIPFFQRRYVWGEDQWEKFWDDLWDSFENNDSHFLGSIILKQVASETGSERLIIDGQQRLTTFSILLKSIMDTLDPEDLPDLLKPSLYSKSSKSRTVKIEHSRHDRDAFIKVMMHKDTELAIDRSDRVISCYHYFLNKITSMNVSENNEQILSFLEKILSDKIWVHITVDADEDEQRIFDSINTSGVVLSEMDVVKNFLFKFLDDDKMEKATEFYNEHWKPIFDDNDEDVKFWDQKVTLGRVERSRSDVLLHNIAVIEGIYNPKEKGQRLDRIGNLYKSKINQYKSNPHQQDEERKQLIKKIVDYAKIFRDLPFPTQNSEYSIRSLPIERTLQIFDALDISTFNAIPLCLEYRKQKDEISQQDCDDCFEMIEQYVMRRAIVGLSTKQYNLIAAELSQVIKNSEDISTDMKNFLSTREGKSEYLPKLEDIKLLSFSNFNARTARIILFWLEINRQRSLSDKSEHIPLSYHSYQLEHLMPKKWQENWSEIPYLSEESRNDHINMIGNFTLLKPKLNVQISNGNWFDKVNGKIICKKHEPGIKECSKLSISQEVVSYEVWDEDKISKRTEVLKKEIVDIWCR
ncbi:MAG: DUF262 domain-containing protein [Brevinema sp.]